MTRPEAVVIVGGGFSAAALTYQLRRQSMDGPRIEIVETGPWLGRGIAYGVESEIFRLNVPASKMSLDPDVPDDFIRYADAGSAPHAFLGRALYGRYVTERLAATLRESRSETRIWRDEAISASADEVVLRSGRRLPFDGLVLATGLTPRLTHVRQESVIDGWDEPALGALPRDGRVLLLGSGLSALDVLAFLEAHGFGGHVTLVSRRGLLPLPHEEPGADAASAGDAEGAPRRLAALVRWVRDLRRQAPDASWQQIADRLRPHVAELYRGLSHRDRARFVRHVRPYWDVVRHRAPADALARVEKLEGEGRLRRIAGRASVVTARAPEVEVEIFGRSGARLRERFDAVVRCIGPALDAAEAETPLVRSLLDAGLARITSHGLGIETLADGRVVDARGEASARIFGLGAVCRASHWETTSVPDIARSAQSLARLLLTARR